MGGCVSLSCYVAGDYDTQLDYSTSPTATVISITGDLRRYSLPTTVQQVLSSEPSPCFMCISDRLLYEEFIPALSSGEYLLPNQIYFILPKSKLLYRLTASDMAAMAVRASLALQKADESRKGRRSRRRPRHSRRRNSKSSQISPVMVDNNYGDSDFGDSDVTVGSGGAMKGKSFENSATVARAAVVTYSRSGSVRKMQRSSSKRVKMAVRSFRMRLSTIYEEGSVF